MNSQSESILFFIVVILVIAFMVYIWYVNRPQPSKPIIIDRQIDHFNQPMQNNEIITIGNHSCAHSSKIIGSPFNLSKN